MSRFSGARASRAFAVPTSFGCLVGLALLSACGKAPEAATPKATRSAEGAPRVLSGALEGKALLGDLPAKASLLGAGPLAIVAASPMAEGERLGAFIEVPKDTCLLAYGRAAPSLEDIDLAAFAEEGNPVAVDEGQDPRPTILVCPPHPDRIYVAAHAASGQGLCVLAAQLVPPERAVEVGRTVGAHGASAKTPEVWPGLDESVKTHRRSLGGTWEEQRRVALNVDARAVSAVAFTVEENGCTDAVVIPDDEVASLDVDVLDGEARLVARAKETSAARSVTLCSSIPIAGSLQVRPHVGRGLVAVVVGKAKGDTAREMLAQKEVVWSTPPSPLDATRSARNTTLTKAGYAAASMTQNGQLVLGRRSTSSIDLVAGGCTRVDVVGGAPLANVEGALWDDGGALLASAEGPDGATLFACGKGKARLDLGTRGRPGPYSVLVRPEKWKDAAFLAHPLAASRMLARAASLAGAVHDGRPGAVRQVVLESAKRSLHDANVPKGQCLRVAAGVEGEGTGVELRLFDAATGEELDRSHGQTSATVRGCAADAPRPMRVEARATAGKLDAVLGERLLAPGAP